MTRDLGPASRPRCLLVWLAVTAGVAVLAAVLLPEVRAARADRFDLLLVTACQVALLGAAGWLWLVTTVVVRDAAHGAGGDRRGVPAPLRRVLLLACGAALVGSLATPSYADPPLPAGDGRGDVSVLQGLRLPDRTTAAGAVATLVAHHAERAERAERTGHAENARRGRSVVVAPGDTLWALAAATLLPGASNAEIATEVQRLYSVNRAIVGADPDLIRPGQVLDLPATRRSS